MIEHTVDVFFYGSYMNFNVLKEVDINERAFEVGSINGYELTISPLANLRYKKQRIAYGILTKLTHYELDRLYQDHAKGKLGGEYLPEAVIVYELNGIYTPALCYISHNMTEGKAGIIIQSLPRMSGQYAAIGQGAQDPFYQFIAQVAVMF